MKSIVDLDNLYFLKAVDRFATAAVQDGFHHTGDDDGYFCEDFLRGMATLAASSMKEMKDE